MGGGWRFVHQIYGRVFTIVVIMWEGVYMSQILGGVIDWGTNPTGIFDTLPKVLSDLKHQCQWYVYGCINYYDKYHRILLFFQPSSLKWRHVYLCLEEKCNINYKYLIIHLWNPPRHCLLNIPGRISSQFDIFKFPTIVLRSPVEPRHYSIRQWWGNHRTALADSSGSSSQPPFVWSFFLSIETIRWVVGNLYMGKRLLFIIYFATFVLFQNSYL